MDYMDEEDHTMKSFINKEIDYDYELTLEDVVDSTIVVGYEKNKCSHLNSSRKIMKQIFNA
jgi:hypothetical protein